MYDHGDGIKFGLDSGPPKDSSVVFGAVFNDLDAVPKAFKGPKFVPGEKFRLDGKEVGYQRKL
jgi:hypothetical protein